MKTLDTNTVLEIIKMIKTRRKNWKEKLKTIPFYNQDEVQYYNGLLDACFEFNQHLQSYIEAELNAAENQSPEQ